MTMMMVFILVERSEGVWLNLPRSGNKCVTEEIHNNVVVVGDYVVISDDHLHPTPSISAKVLFMCMSFIFCLIVC